MKYSLLMLPFFFFAAHGMELAQVYEHEEINLPLQVYVAEEVNIKMAKPISYFSLLPQGINAMVKTYWYAQQSPQFYFSLLPYDVKRKVGTYMKDLSHEEIIDLIDRDKKDELYFAECQLINSPHIFKNYLFSRNIYFEDAMNKCKWNAAKIFFTHGCTIKEDEITLRRWWSTALSGCTLGMQNFCSGKIVRALMQKGTTNYTVGGKSSLQYAARFGNYKAAKLLIKAGGRCKCSSRQPKNSFVSCGICTR